MDNFLCGLCQTEHLHCLHAQLSLWPVSNRAFTLLTCTWIAFSAACIKQNFYTAYVHMDSFLCGLYRAEHLPSLLCGLHQTKHSHCLHAHGWLFLRPVSNRTFPQLSLCLYQIKPMYNCLCGLQQVEHLHIFLWGPYQTEHLHSFLWGLQGRQKRYETDLNPFLRRGETCVPQFDSLVLGVGDKIAGIPLKPQQPPHTYSMQTYNHRSQITLNTLWTQLPCNYHAHGTYHLPSSPHRSTTAIQNNNNPESYKTITTS